MVMYQQYIVDMYKDQVLQSYTADVEQQFSMMEYEKILNMNLSSAAVIATTMMATGIPINKIAKIGGSLMSLRDGVEKLTLMGKLDFDIADTLEDVVQTVQLI